MVDSGADLQPQIARLVEMVSLTVTFGQHEYVAGVDMGSVVGTHVGPGAVAAAFFAAE